MDNGALLSCNILMPMFSYSRELFFRQYGLVWLIGKMLLCRNHHILAAHCTSHLSDSTKYFQSNVTSWKRSVAIDVDGLSLTWVNPFSSASEIIKMFRFFITNHDRMQDYFLHSFANACSKFYFSGAKSTFLKQKTFDVSKLIGIDMYIVYN